MFSNSALVIETVCLAATNLALGKPTLQSSLYVEKSAPRLAVDGNTNSDWAAGSCSRSGLDVNPYWQLDLLYIYTLLNIQLYNPQGHTYGSRLENIEILVSNGVIVTFVFLFPQRMRKFAKENQKKSIPNDNINFKLVAVNNDDNTNMPIIDFHIADQSISARYLRVLIRGTKKILTLCEVKVRGVASTSTNMHRL